MGCPRRHHPHARLLGAVLALTGVLAGCPQTVPDPCESVACDEGLRCVVVDGATTCLPPADPCGADNPCRTDEVCAVTARGTATCLAPDRCAGVTCPVGKACDDATGECTVERPACSDVRCPAGEECDPATNRCRAIDDKCGSICCGTNQVCDPATGGCVPDRCADADYVCKCHAGQVCESITGACLDVPGPCGAPCAVGEKCDVASGRCVAIARGIPTSGAVGSPCTTAADCSLAGFDSFCIEDEGIFGTMPGGLCSAACERAACPDGTGCVDFGVLLCMDVCLDNTDCRSGYTCANLDGSGARYCFPTSPAGSTCTGPQCGAMGSACREDDDCVAGSTCARSGFPGGYCLKRGCRNTGSSAECDQASENCLCLQTDTCGESFLALGKCDPALQDCRPGYACLNATATTGFCYPRVCRTDLDCRVVGDRCSTDFCDAARGICDAPCRTDAQCTGGRRCDAESGRCYQRCRFSSDNCGPDAVCDTGAQRCVAKCQSDAMCAEGQFCDRASGRCATRCSSEADCRNGEFCDRLGQCRPSCEDDAGCGTNEYCDTAGRCVPRCSSTSGCTFGEFCDTTSGRCRHDLRQVLVGHECATNGECGAYNAVCLSGAAYPGGYCTTLPCSAAEPCGAGAACVVHDGAQRCLAACSPGAEAACRSGYACRTVGSQTVCVPATE